MLTLVLVPLGIGQLKATTNIFTPAQIQRYGGTMPHTRVLARYDDTTRPATRGRGWPAGHASGGFALLSLAGLARTRRGQLIGVSTGLALGGIMGLYQTFKGDHFLSHSLITALLAWLAFLAATAIPAAITLRRTAGRPRMLKLAAAGTSLAALVAMALTGAPVIALRLCH